MLGNLAAFKNPDSQIVVVILNDKRETLCAWIRCLGYLIRVELERWATFFFGVGYGNIFCLFPTLFPTCYNCFIEVKRTGGRFEVSSIAA